MMLCTLSRPDLSPRCRSLGDERLSPKARCALTRLRRVKAPSSPRGGSLNPATWEAHAAVGMTQGMHACHDSPYPVYLRNVQLAAGRVL